MDHMLFDLETWLWTLDWVEGIVLLGGMILLVVIGMIQRAWYNWRMSDEEREQIQDWRRGPFRLPPSRISADR